MKKKSSYGIVIILIILAALSRLLPHPPNVTPIAAIGLFGAYYLGKKWMKYIILFGALFLSDFLINNTIMRVYYPDVKGLVFFSDYMVGVYLGFLAVILIGNYLLKSINTKSLFSTTMLGSLVFYLITNFNSWLTSPIYSKDFGGLIASYYAGLPFFFNSIFGNLFFVGLMFGGMYLHERNTLKLADQV